MNKVMKFIVKACFIVSLVSAALGFVVMINGGGTATIAMIAMGIGLAVVPYCFSRCLETIASKNL